jgi:succinate dehydrogenase / fumarate reductase flavoprotein subunit
MFNSIPEPYRNQTSDNEEEGWRYIQGDKNAKRPPELLTRDHVARCIVREIKEGRGSPHGGVYLDISWIKKKISNSEEHIKKKLPGMFHMFKKLADIDITKEPMEIGPTTLYMMGGIRVVADTQMSTLPGLFAAGECGAGLHGANRLGGNSLSDLLVFGKRAGKCAAEFAKENNVGIIDEKQIKEAADWSLLPFEREKGDSPFDVQFALQEMMQQLVGIVRNETEMLRAKEHLRLMNQRAMNVRVTGNREFNPGWHTALDLRNMLIASEAITMAALERKESRGAHFREDFPDKDPQSGKFNLVIKKNNEGKMTIRQAPIPEIREDLKKIIEEMK